jgi:hypothetical protein
MRAGFMQQWYDLVLTLLRLLHILYIPHAAQKLCFDLHNKDITFSIPQTSTT